MTPHYQDEAVTIYHGDCRDVIPSLPPVDAVVTSPPYNTLHGIPENASGLWGRSAGGEGFVKALAEKGYADDRDESEYQAEQIAIMDSIRCHETASLFYNHQLRWRDGVCLHPVQWFQPKCWRLRSEIIWNRAGGMMFNARMFTRFDERILWMVRGRNHKWNQSEVGLGTVWNVARMQKQQGKEHPVEFPIGIPERCIRASTDPGDLVLDPFMGSGTTLRAAKDLGRKVIGIELEEKYCEMAARRMQQEVLPLYEQA